MVYNFFSVFAVKTYLSPVETHCNNINYYIPDENNETRDFTDDAWTRLRKSFNHYFFLCSLACLLHIYSSMKFFLMIVGRALSTIPIAIHRKHCLFTTGQGFSVFCICVLMMFFFSCIDDGTN